MAYAIPFACLHLSPFLKWSDSLSSKTGNIVRQGRIFQYIPHDGEGVVIDGCVIPENSPYLSGIRAEKDVLIQTAKIQKTVCELQQYVRKGEPKGL